MSSILSEFIKITQRMIALAINGKQCSQEFLDLNERLIASLASRNREDDDEDEIQYRMEGLINFVNAVYVKEDIIVSSEYVIISKEEANDDDVFLSKEDADDDDVFLSKEDANVPDLESGTMSMTYDPNLGLGKKVHSYEFSDLNKILIRNRIRDRIPDRIRDRIPDRIPDRFYYEIQTRMEESLNLTNAVCDDDDVLDLEPVNDDDDDVADLELGKMLMTTFRIEPDNDVDDQCPRFGARKEVDNDQRPDADAYDNDTV